MTKPIKLAQITDLHLRADPATQMRGKNIQQQVDRVFNALLEHPLWPADIVALTGDIADETDKQAFSSVYQALSEKLAALNIQVCCIPGNHDHPPLLHSMGSENILTHGILRIGNWQILLLDSCVPGQVGGELSMDQFRQIEQCLMSESVEHLMFLVHHPALDIGCHWLDQIRLNNGKQFLDKLSSYNGTKIVLCGHVHQEFDQVYQDIRLLGTPAACPVQFKPKSDEFAVDEVNSSGFRWCQLYEDGSINTRVERVNN